MHQTTDKARKHDGCAAMCPAEPTGSIVPSNITLRQLEYFLAIADSRSMSEAAALLHASPSAVAGALTTLERSLGVRLCVRRRAYGVSLTTSGRELRDRARALVAEAALLEQDFTGSAAPVSGAVLIGGSDEMAPTILPPIIDALSRKHPGLVLTAELGLEESFWPRVSSGEVDVAIALDHRLPVDLDFIRLRPMPVQVVLPAGHPLAERERVELADLVDESWIMLDTEPGATHAASMFHTAGLSPKVAFRSPSSELARSLVGRGLGYTIHIHRPYGDVSHEGRALAVRPLETGLPVEHVALAWSRRMRPSPATRAVIAAAREVWKTADQQQAAPESG